MAENSQYGPFYTTSTTVSYSAAPTPSQTVYTYGGPQFQSSASSSVPPSSQGEPSNPTPKHHYLAQQRPHNPCKSCHRQISATVNKYINISDESILDSNSSRQKELESNLAVRYRFYISTAVIAVHFMHVTSCRVEITIYFCQPPHMESCLGRYCVLSSFIYSLSHTINYLAKYWLF